MCGLFCSIKELEQVFEGSEGEAESGCNSSRAVLYGLMASESFSLALQQRAAREVVSEEMSRRALATRLLLFCEITSALLIVELGLFVHMLAMVVALIIVPVLDVVRMGLREFGMVSYAWVAFCLGLRVRWSSGECFSFHPRDLPFASIFTNPRCSSFGLRRGQKGNSLNAPTIILARVACAVVLMHVVLNACQARHPFNIYRCECRELNPDSQKCGRYHLYGGDTPKAMNGDELCRNYQNLAVYDYSYVQLCGEVKLPEWMQGTCRAGHMDAREYFYCRKRSWYPEYCNARFRVCAMFLEASESLDTFILQVCCIVPPLGLALMLLIHLAGFIVAKQTNQPSLMNVSENSELRQRIRTKACHFEQQLQKEQLEHSIWCPGQNCIMDWWWVSVNIIASILLQCK